MKPIRTIAVASLLAVALTGAAWATTMDDQKELSAQAIGMWGDASLMDRIGDTLADGYMNHQVPDVNGGTQTIDEAAWIELLTGFHQSFSDVSVEILMQIGEGDQVATRWRFTATQTGTYLGLAPTDETISWTGIQIDRFEDGLIAESWVNWDMYGMFEQLGLVGQ